MPCKWLCKRRGLCYNPLHLRHQKGKCHECVQACQGERPAYSGLFLFGGGTEIGTPLEIVLSVEMPTVNQGGHR